MSEDLFNLNELPVSPLCWSPVLSEFLVQPAQFVPEEQGQNGVRTESEIRGSKAFVESRQTFVL